MFPMIPVVVGCVVVGEVKCVPAMSEFWVIFINIITFLYFPGFKQSTWRDHAKILISQLFPRKLIKELS